MIKPFTIKGFFIGGTIQKIALTHLGFVLKIIHKSLQSCSSTVYFSKKKLSPFTGKNTSKEI